jgi:hypothetical protein
MRGAALVELWCILQSYTVDPTWLRTPEAYREIVDQILPSKLTKGDHAIFIIATCIVWLLSQALSEDDALSDTLIIQAFGLWGALASSLPNPKLDKGVREYAELAETLNPISRSFVLSITRPMDSGRTRVQNGHSDMIRDVSYGIRTLVDALYPAIDLRGFAWQVTSKGFELSIDEIIETAASTKWIDRRRLGRLLRVQRKRGTEMDYP